MPKSTSRKQAPQPKKKQSKRNSLPSRSLQDLIFGNPKKFPGPVLNNKKKPNPSNKKGLSACALKYALAIAEPFHPSARNVCIPCPPAIPSQKVASFNRQAISLNVNGYAAAYIHPCLANDGGLITYTAGSTFLGGSATGFQFLTATNVITVGGAIASPSNLPYSTAQLFNSFPAGASQVFGRVVSVGVKIHYTGTTLNESGLYSLYASNSHENVSVIAATPGQVGALLDSEICAVTRKPCVVSTTTCNPRETTYTNSDYSGTNTSALYPYSSGDTAQGVSSFTYSISSATLGSPVIAIHMTGVAGSTFLLEIIQHVEYGGPLTSALATNSEVDVDGFNVVNSAATKLPGKKLVSSASPVQQMFECIQDVFQEVKPIAISALLKYGAGMLM